MGAGGAPLTLSFTYSMPKLREGIWGRGANSLALPPLLPPSRLEKGWVSPFFCVTVSFFHGVASILDFLPWWRGHRI